MYIFINKYILFLYLIIASVSFLLLSPSSTHVENNTKSLFYSILGGCSLCLFIYFFPIMYFVLICGRNIKSFLCIAYLIPAHFLAVGYILTIFSHPLLDSESLNTSLHISFSFSATADCLHLHLIVIVYFC